MQTPPDASGKLPTWARAADALAIGLAALGLLIATFGGVRLHLGATRLSLTSPWRVLIWAVGLTLVRHIIIRRNPLYRRFVSGMRDFRGSDAFHAAWPTFVTTRLAVLLVGYFAVVTIGYPMRDVPNRISDNEFLNLPSRWDTGWYFRIATNGYDRDPDPSHQQTFAFFPAYPMLMRIGGRLLGQQSLLVGMVVSLGAFFVALLYLYRLARERMDHESAMSALVLLASYPFALFYSAAYTESLFLCGAVAAFYHLHRREYVKAGLWGLLTGLTRPNGCLLSIPLAVLIFEPRLPLIDKFSRASAEKPLKPFPALLAAAMPGIGMLLFSGYVYTLAGNPFAWASAHAAWGRSYKPLDALVTDRYRHIAAQGLYEYTASLPLDVLNGLAALFVLALAWPTMRRLGVAYGLFLLVNLFPPLMAGGLLSIGRVTCVFFPIFLWLAQAVPVRHRPAWVGAFAMGQALNAALFFTWRPLY